MDTIYIPKRFLGFFLFGVTGVCTEIFFTAFQNLYYAWAQGSSPEMSLTGKSYVWMFPIYGSASFFLNRLMPYLRKLPFGLRLVVYPLGIFMIEYITGWLLDMTIGKCPWEYESSYAVHGYINLAYTPFWMLFGVMLEIIFNTVQRFRE
jgi:uncharacterized membrane protein